MEEKIADIYVRYFKGNFEDEVKNRLKILEQAKMKLLEDKEAQWRLKSRALWLANGDEHTINLNNWLHIEKT